MTVDRQRLADSFNHFELKFGLPIIVEHNLGTHRPDCIHVGWVADQYEAGEDCTHPITWAVLDDSGQTYCAACGKLMSPSP